MCTRHVPVLAKKMLDNWILPQKSRASAPLVYLDATFGHGSMTRLLLENGISVVGCDRDELTFQYARNIGQEFNNLTDTTFRFYNYSFSQLQEKLSNLSFDGMLMDLGTSNMQLRNPERGFSFMKNGILDMRMTKSLQITAMDVVNQMPEKELADIILNYGEERLADLISRSIVTLRKQKQISTTLELVKAIEHATPLPFKKKAKNRTMNIHPATKTFQALRIYVNNELIELKKALSASDKLVKKEGLLFVISFHSLEDRIVKQHLQSSLWALASKRPILPEVEEIESNRQSRSAKLRIALRTENE